MSSVGFLDWILSILGLRVGAAPQAFDPNNTVIEVNPERGTIEEFVVTPCGYRIRVPATDEVSHSVGEMLPNVRACLAQVPPLPQVVIELLREVQDTKSTAASVANVASTDPVLAAALLRTVNSSAMGLSRKITSVTEAVSYLGFGLVKSVLVRLRLDETLPTTGKMGGDAEDLWVHSLATSYVAEALADRVKTVDRGFVSTLGLLHDIGKLAMMSQLKMQGQMALAPSPEEHGRSREARVLGVDHAGLGAALAHAWGLPADLVCAIRFHHHPEQAFQASDPLPLRQAMMIVYIANQLAKFGYGHADDIEVATIPADAAELLGIDTSLSGLMTPKVTGAITKAILFASENSKQPKTAVKRLIKMRRGQDAVQFAKMQAQISPRLTVDDGIANVFNAESDAASVLRAAGTNRESDIAKLIDAGLFHQSKLSLTPHLAANAGELLKCLLPNLIEAIGDRPVDLVQQRAGASLVVAVRCESIGFTHRVGVATTTEQGLTLLQAEFAGLINLGWVESIRTSADGTMLALEMTAR